ncbi:SMC-Scp complex subunit ScpB [Legionella impletisoli]|uniref:Segregation and condensation protein B n=1 Tax=Legionella impletisoli TaxID=343510 RepID=A0A917JLG1_9GAMM|nr:SMC-Scp complex subunit ScpB [Legionella impletisoli]GGI75373.1 segregation and condensation protein B [Legionella impletisoli]
MNHELKLILEALLMSHGSPLSIHTMLTVFDESEKPTVKEVEEALNNLTEEYQKRAIELIQVAGGYRVQTKPQYSGWIEKLLVEKPARYSRALLETLAIIAYKQPVTRGDIEEIRGVAVSSTIIKTLLEREWIRVAGHRDVPGKPAVYTTTKQFLEYFNLKTLNDLPSLKIPVDVEAPELI